MAVLSLRRRFLNERLAIRVRSGPPGPLVISGTPPAAAVGTAYAFFPGVAGGSGAKSFSRTGTLPPGLSFSSTTGAITGTPTTAGSFSGISLTVTDTTGSASLSGLSIAVSAAAMALNALTVPTATATVGTNYSGTLSGQTAGSTLSLSGAGAAGLSVSAGSISGTPTTAGPVDVIETLAGATNSPRTTAALITVSAAAATNAILREDGFYLLREDGSRILREAA